MRMDKTVRALTDLSLVDDELSDKGALKDGTALALEARRAALRGAIPEILLEAYDALGRASRRPVVVAVRGAHCGGCHLRLPPQLGSAIHRDRSLCPCPHCRRLLYLRPRGEESKSARAPEDHLADRRASGGGASTRVRRTPARRRVREEAHAAERRSPRGNAARAER